MKCSKAARLALLAALAAMPAAPANAQAPTGLQHEVVFSDYTPLAGNAELLRRMLSPLDEAQVQHTLNQQSEQLSAQSVDLAQERFVLYVPPKAPAGGYALLVFVPPWHDARLPEGWPEVLDRYDMICVSAARSGNDQNVSARREPLALLAAYNVMQRYPVNPAHVYVAGFSGGSRVAMRLAVGYPDLFRGALLNAGADPLGVPGAAIPPAELMQRLQESSRLVYVTGERDPVLPTDVQSRQSMHKWCVANVDSQITLGRSHEALNAFAFNNALRALTSAPQPDTGKLAACRAGLQHELEPQLARVQTLIGSGKHGEAQKLLRELDRQFGGLAAPASLELQRQLGGS